MIVIAATKLIEVEVQAVTVLYQVSAGHVSSAEIGVGVCIETKSVRTEADDFVLFTHSSVTAATSDVWTVDRDVGHVKHSTVGETGPCTAPVTRDCTGASMELGLVIKLVMLVGKRLSASDATTKGIDASSLIETLIVGDNLEILLGL